MPLVCRQCAMYSVSNADKSSNVVSCSQCGASYKANILPLFIVTGASGSGKTAVMPELRSRLAELMVFEKDLLWGRGAEGQFTNNWLRIVYSTAQQGYHSVICGTMMPWDIERSEDRSLIGPVHFLNLHCSDVEREKRLRARPEWRNVKDETIEEHRNFAHWLIENAATEYQPPMKTLDTTSAAVGEVADSITAWIRGIIGQASRRGITAAPTA